MAKVNKKLKNPNQLDLFPEKKPLDFTKKRADQYEFNIKDYFRHNTFHLDLSNLPSDFASAINFYNNRQKPLFRNISE
jgi:hypothetical protein